MKTVLLFSMLFFLSLPGGAQGEEIFSYTPGVLLEKGELEAKLFFNLYTQTHIYDSDGERVESQGRQTYLTTIVNTLYGVENGLNVGLDLYIKSVREGASSSSPLEVFRFSSDSGSRTALAYVAPRIKLAPFRSLRSFALQSSVLFPAERNLEGRPHVDRPFLDYDAVQWWMQLLYDISLWGDFVIYTEGSLLFRFMTKRTDFLTPVKLLVNYYPSRAVCAYLLAEIGPTWDGLSWSSYYSQAGFGLKYLLASSVELEALASLFPAGRSNGAGQTYNLGFRILH